MGLCGGPAVVHRGAGEAESGGGGGIRRRRRWAGGCGGMVGGEGG